MAVLIVVTNHGDLGNTGKKTGWYLPEVAHPYYAFKKHGINVTIASINGGDTPVDPSSVEAFKEDPECKQFLADEDAQKQVKNSVVLKQVDLSQFQAVFYAGGHGPMFDLPQSAVSNNVATKIYEANGVVGAVCHGTVGLLNAKLSNGKWLVYGHELTCFTNAEENAVQLMEVMPFALETKLIEHGAKFKGAADWSENVVVSDRIITGQNPASASATAEAMSKRIKEL